MSDAKRVSLGIASEESVAVGIRLSMRNYFSTNFLWTAMHTSRLVGEFEAAEGERPRFEMAHRSLAAASVIASGAFLEAAASELFQDAHDGHGLREDGYLSPLSPPTVASMAMVWRATKNGRNTDPVEKWQWMLECAGLPPLDRGAQPFQDAALLVRIRNALVHFKPENIAADEEHELEKRLRGKFPSNQLMNGSGNPWWPDHGLGHGCTECAIHSARALAERVLDALAVTPNYRRIEEAGWNGTVP